MKKLMIRSLAIFAVLWLGVVLMNRFSSPANQLGVQDNLELSPCPESPNCVSTYATDSQHAIAAIDLVGTPEETLQIARTALESMPGIQIVSVEANYLRATATTRLMRYIDDIELHINGQDDKLHFRSASRIGYSDMGANRKRMEQFRSAFQTLSEQG